MDVFRTMPKRPACQPCWNEWGKPPSVGQPAVEALGHDDFELDKGTGAGGGRPEKEMGQIHLQGHGNPVRFQNIWLVEK